MSYGSKVCPKCQGEMRVYFEGDGSSFGTCPTCGESWKFAPMTFRPHIDPKGAFYEVRVREELYEEDGPAYGNVGKSYKCTVLRDFETLGIYTDLDAALKRVDEVKAEADTHLTDTSYVHVYWDIKRWNHDRTEWEFWRPEYRELDKEVFA